MVTTMSFCAAAHAVSLFQTDNFSSGTTEGWGSGGPNPNPPMVIANGGPAGDGDAYLQLTSNGMGGSGGRPVVFNQTQWAGDYLSAGITAIALDVANFGATDVNLALRVEGSGGIFSTVVPVSILAGSGWQQIMLDLDDAALAGGSDLQATLANTTRLRFEDPGAPFVATIGLDNITAVPEPTTMCLMVLGSALMLRNRRMA